MNGTKKYRISTEHRQHFKPHVECGKWNVGSGKGRGVGGEIIINTGKRYKPSSKGIFMSLGFLIKISLRFKK